VQHERSLPLFSPVSIELQDAAAPDIGIHQHSIFRAPASIVKVGDNMRSRDLCLCAFISGLLACGPTQKTGVNHIQAPDSDNDGIADSRDRCPSAAEDHDGLEDHDGCVDEDNDGDFIPDRADKCPNEPEDVDGKDDADGCPEEGAPWLSDGGAVVNAERGTVELTKGSVEFEPGTATMTTQGEVSLTHVAYALMQSGQGVRIEVHVARSASATQDARLQEKELSVIRAQSIQAKLEKFLRVRAYLVATADGLGSSRPLSSYPASDDKQNRVHFYLTEVPIPAR
jgi:flagellar motor protein MotB